MALRVSPERVRDVRFAEQWRGYRTDEVDEFIEQVAEAIDQLERRLEEAAQRAEAAERQREERGPDDDLRRTLVLAQRTADAALKEAKAEAARTVAEAEEKARQIQDQLNERKAKMDDEIEARIRAELGQLDDRRAALETEVELLTAYVEDHRGRLVQELRTQLGWLERAGPLEPMPASLSRPIPPPPVADTAVAQSDATFSEAPAPSTADETPSDEVDTVEAVGGGVAVTDDPGGGPHRSAPDEEVAGASSQDDDTALDDLDVIPWEDDPSDEDTFGVASPGEGDDGDDDPFIAELRRAVDDPEPLGPRDEPGAWSDDVDLYDRHKAGPMRSRRRRRP